MLRRAAKAAATLTALAIPVSEQVANSLAYWGESLGKTLDHFIPFCSSLIKPVIGFNNDCNARFYHFI
jgi:hypothetical protein